MKISNLPKTAKSSSADLVMIVQGGVVKNISVSDLTKGLVSGGEKLAAEVRALRKELAKNTINVNNPILTKPLKIPTPKGSGDAANKGYIDTKVSHLIKVDGSSSIVAPLSYKGVDKFNNNDLVSKEYADGLLDAALKVVKELTSDAYPAASSGDVFIALKGYPLFAENGPELQKGDILICLSKSVGGTHGEVGEQFAIINTNVVLGTKDIAGTLKLSSFEEMETMDAMSSAVSPRGVREALESSSVYNRRLIDFGYYEAKEADKGILGVDSRRGAVEIRLPSVSSLSNPKLTKFTIKDEFGHADINNITVKGSSSDVIENLTSLALNQKFQAVTIYNDGKNYYIESNTHNKRENSTAGAGSGTLKSAAKGYASTLNIDDPVYSFDIDLSQYDVNEGFEIEYYGSFSDTTNNTADLMINSVSIATTGVITSLGTFKLTATVLKSADLRGYVVSSIGVDGVVVNNNFTSMDLDNWLNTVSVQATLNCSTSLVDAIGHMFIVKPLK